MDYSLSSTSLNLLFVRSHQSEIIMDATTRQWCQLALVSMHLAEKHFPENHLPEKHFPDGLFSRISIFRNHYLQNEHLPEITSARMNTFLKLHLPEWTLSFLKLCTSARMNISLKLHFPKNLFYRIYTCQNLHLAEISPKAYFPEFTLVTF